MRRILFFTLLVFCVAGIYSCRKDNSVATQTIKQFDQQQIQDYMTANGLTGFSRDLSGGDTTGIYYKILTKGTGKTFDYSDLITMVFTVQTLDGSFVTTDTIENHVYNYVGHVDRNNLPFSVANALVNIVKAKGTRARVIIPSHLAYGVAGKVLSPGGAANTIKGNQGLDYYINVIDNLDTYDDMVVKNYVTANNLTGFTKTPSGLYYKITTPAAGAAVTSVSLVTTQYTATLLNGLGTSEAVNGTDGSGAIIDIANDTRKGLIEGLLKGTAGTKMTLIMPSRLAYGLTAYYDFTIPIFSCLKYDINILSVQ